MDQNQKYFGIRLFQTLGIEFRKNFEIPRFSHFISVNVCHTVTVKVLEVCFLHTMPEQSQIKPPFSINLSRSRNISFENKEPSDACREF